jgi:hypothetical protein
MDCKDADAVRYLMTADQLERVKPPTIEVAALAQYDRPIPVMDEYDQLIGSEVRR